LEELVAACCTGIWITSHEHEDAIREAGQMCRDRDWRLMTWDVDQGLQVAGADEPVDAGASDPVAAVRSVGALATPDSSALLVLTNFHRFLGSAEVVQAVAHQIVAGKQNRTFLVVLAPLVDLPPELEKLFTIVEHHLPDRGELEAIARGVATEGAEMPEGDGLDLLLDAAAGMTRLEAENVFALSLVRHGRLDPATVFEHKAQALKKGNRALALYDGDEHFSDIGGLDHLKTYCLETLAVREANPKFQPRGVMIMGVSGTGKSLFAKALGRETGRPTLCFDIGRTLGSLMGQSQAQFREALEKAEAMAPCILFVDEIEKALSGAGHDGHTSGGVKTEIFGHFLTWLQDRTADVFLVSTCNRIRAIADDHPEFLRRFDQLFFVDYPDRQAKDRIWEIHLRGYELIGTDDDAGKVSLPKDDQWTGAEIERCCRLARLRRKSPAQIGQTMPRIADQAGEAIDETRRWADGRCYSADREEVYQSGAADSKGSRRKVRLSPSDN
jgi:predicted kinase